MSGFEEISCRWEGREIHGYRLRGRSGRGRNLVLIPGSGTHHTIWEPVIEDAGIPADILLAELPGFGKCSPREPDGTIEGFTSLVLRLADEAGMGRFFIGGHSIGGMMSIEMLDHAGDRLDGIVSCEGWTHASAQADAFGTLKDETLTEEQGRLRDRYYALARGGWTEEEFKRYAKIWRKWEKGRRLLECASAPILELWGDRGMKERPGQDRLQIPDRPNIELVWLPGCGHSMLVQQPRRIGELMAAFIGEVRGDG